MFYVCSISTFLWMIVYCILNVVHRLLLDNEKYYLDQDNDKIKKDTPTVG